MVCFVSPIGERYSIIHADLCVGRHDVTIAVCTLASILPTCLEVSFWWNDVVAPEEKENGKIEKNNSIFCLERHINDKKAFVCVCETKLYKKIY